MIQKLKSHLEFNPRQSAKSAAYSFYLVKLETKSS